MNSNRSGRSKPHLFIETEFDSEDELATQNPPINNTPLELFQIQPSQISTQQIIYSRTHIDEPHNYKDYPYKANQSQSKYTQIKDQIHRSTEQFKNALSRMDHRHPQLQKSNMTEVHEMLGLKPQKSVQLIRTKDNTGQDNRNNSRDKNPKSIIKKINPSTYNNQRPQTNILESFNKQPIRVPTLDLDGTASPKKIAVQTLSVFYTLWYRKIASQFMKRLKEIPKPTRRSDKSRKILFQLSSTLQKGLSDISKHSYSLHHSESDDYLRKNLRERSKRVLTQTKTDRDRSLSNDSNRSFERAKILHEIVDKLRMSRQGSQKSLILDQSQYEEKKKSIRLETKIDKIQMMLKQIKRVNKASTQQSAIRVVPRYHNTSQEMLQEKPSTKNTTKTSHRQKTKETQVHHHIHYYDGRSDRDRYRPATKESQKNLSITNPPRQPSVSKSESASNSGARNSSKLLDSQNLPDYSQHRNIPHTARDPIRQSMADPFITIGESQQYLIREPGTVQNLSSKLHRSTDYSTSYQTNPPAYYSMQKATAVPTTMLLQDSTSRIQQQQDYRQFSFNPNRSQSLQNQVPSMSYQSHSKLVEPVPLPNDNFYNHIVQPSINFRPPSGHRVNQSYTLPTPAPTHIIRHIPQVRTNQSFSQAFPLNIPSVHNVIKRAPIFHPAPFVNYPVQVNSMSVARKCTMCGNESHKPDTQQQQYGVRIGYSNCAQSNTHHSQSKFRL